MRPARFGLQDDYGPSASRQALGSTVSGICPFCAQTDPLACSSHGLWPFLPRSLRQHLFSHTNSKWKSKLQCEGNFMIFKIWLEPSVLKVNHQLWWFCYCKKILKVTYLTVLLPLASKFCNLKDISLGRGSKMYFN